MERCASLLVAVVVVAGCTSPSGDPPASYNPNPLGPGLRIKDVVDPMSPNHPSVDKSGVGPSVYVTGASMSWLDTFDETQNGKSRGTLYIQDTGSTAPYSGIGVYSVSYIPADLRTAPGDVLDFTGPYEELGNIGAAMFPTGQVLIQLSKPVATFRYEYKPPDPAIIDPNDLNDYTKGLKWESMLVTVQNVTLTTPFVNDGKGRVTAYITADTSMTGVEISNELYDLKATDFPPAAKFKSVTGIVTWFFQYHIAPRSPDDLKQ